MNRRIVWSVVSVALLAAAMSVGSALFSANETRAEDPARAGARAADLDKDKQGPVPAPSPASATLPTTPAAVAPLSGTPGPASYTPAYPTPGPGVSEARDGTLTVQDVFQLRALKKRIGGDNLKRLVDALAD